MRREDWPVGDHGVRPVSEAEDVCTYCRQPRGEQHKPDCAIRQRTIVVRMTVEYVQPIVEDWDEEMINFYFNEGTHCSSNDIEYMHRRMRHLEAARAQCLCRNTHIVYVREAEEEDEQDMDVFVAAAPS